MVVMVCANGLSLWAQDATDQYFDGLLDRGLVRVAQNEALRRLEDEPLKPIDRVNWTLRLAQAYGRQSELVRAEDRAIFQQRADDLLANLEAFQPPLPKQEAIAVERVMLMQTRANILLVTSEASPEDTKLRQTAEVAIREVIERYRVLLRELSDAARGASRRTSAQLADGELSAGDIRRMIRDVELRLAQSLVSLIEALPNGSDYAATVNEADERLRRLSDGWIGERRTWEARLLRAKLARIQGDPQRAASIVQNALSDDPNDWLVDRFMAELVRSQLAAEQVDVALQTLLDHSRQRQVLGGELGYLQVEALLAGWRLASHANEADTAEEFLTRANRRAELLEGVWRARALLLIDRARENNVYGEEVAKLVQVARGAYASGKTDEALAGFERASEQAIALNQSAAADEFDYIRASILIDQSRFAEASAVLDDLFTRSPDAKQAEDAGLLQAYSRGRLYDAEPTRLRREEYVAVLQRHREQYHGRPSFGEATWMLATFEEGRQQWTTALDLYREIVADPARGSLAQLRVAVLYEQILDRLREIEQPRDEWEDRAIEDLTEYIHGYPKNAGELTLTQAEVIVRLVRIALGHREQAYAAVDRQIEPVLLAAETQRRNATRDERSLDPEWERLARAASQLRVVSLAGQGRVDEARKVFETLAVTEPRTLLRIFLGLSKLAERIPSRHRQALAHLQLDAADRLQRQRSALNESEQQALDESRAEAYIAAGNIYDAASIYQSLLSSHPNDRRLMQTVARLLTRHEGTDAARQSLAIWQKIEGMERKGTRPWFEARLQMAELYVRLGRHQDAHRLIALTRLVYPELGGEDLLQRFESLLQRLPASDQPQGSGRP